MYSQKILQEIIVERNKYKGKGRPIQLTGSFQINTDFSHLYSNLQKIYNIFPDVEINIIRKRKIEKIMNANQ
jgi:predicted transcriptional regulator